MAPPPRESTLVFQRLILNFMLLKKKLLKNQFYFTVLYLNTVVKKILNYHFSYSEVNQEGWTVYPIFFQLNICAYRE